jgi:GNAT superfamily N-acetyltransferase
MTGASLVVRRGEPAEAARLTEIARAAKAHWGYPAAWRAAWEGDLTLTPEYVAANRVFVAERDALVVGVCALEDHADRWLLEHVWVDPAHHGAGVGPALVGAALDAVRRVRPGVVMAAADPQAAGSTPTSGRARPVAYRPPPGLAGADAAPVRVRRAACLVTGGRARPSAAAESRKPAPRGRPLPAASAAA